MATMNDDLIPKFLIPYSKIKLKQYMEKVFIWQDCEILH